MTNLLKGINLLHFNLQWINLHEYIFRRKILLNKFSKDKTSWTHLHERNNLLNKSSMDKSPWTHFHEWKNLLNKSSKDKSPWSNLQKGINLLHFNLQWTNFHEHVFIKGKISWTNLRKEKCSEQIFKGKISWINLQMTNFHEHIFIKGKKKNLLNKSSKDKSPWTHLHENVKSPEQIFRGQISMNKFQKINDENFSKDYKNRLRFSF